MINIGSIAGLRGFEQGGVYSEAKAAVISLNKVMSLEYGRYGIRVNCICTGQIQTGMFEDLVGQRAKDVSTDVTRREIAGAIPIGRIGTPPDVAKMVVYLAFPDSSFVNGRIFVVDGGATAGHIAPPQADILREAPDRTVRCTDH